MSESVETLLITGGNPAVAALAGPLHSLGARVSAHEHPGDGIRAARETLYTLLIVDGTLGRSVVLALCQDLRAMPVNGQGLLVLAGGDEADLPQLIEAGVDELLPARASAEYMQARIKALATRARRRAARRNVEATIRETEARVRAVLDTAQDGIITIDEKGIIEGFNPAAERIFGYAAADVIGHNVSMLMPDPYRSEHNGHIREYLDTGVKRVVGTVRQLTGRRKDGTEFPLELAVGETTVGSRRLFTGVARDTSDRTAAEAQIRLSNRLFRAVSSAQSRFITDAGTDQVFHGLLEDLLEITGSQWGLLAGIDTLRTGLPVVVPQAVGEPGSVGSKDVPELELFIQNSPLYKVFDTGSPAILNGPDLTVPAGVLPRDVPPLLRLAVLPLASGDDAMGLAVLANREREYDAELIDVLAPLLSTGASLLQASRAEDDRRNARRALEKSHEDLQVVLNGLRIGTAITDANGQITFLSDTARALCPSNLGAAPGKRFDECIPISPADRDRVRATAALPPEERAKVAVHLPATGDRVDLWLELEVVDDPRDPTRRIYLIYDVTDLHGLRRMLSEKATFHKMVGNSKPMRVLFQQIQEVAQVDWTVLVEGETGTGKELVAGAVHAASPRAERPFIAVNAAGLTDSVLASQLFGHKRGAFTGAVTDHKGFFEAAEGGTIFLDEIGDIPMGVQTSLLRVLQEREITRLGESVPRKVDVRVVAATNRDLSHEVEKGAFRADLLYRLRVARVQLPPLRERREDIPLLAAATLAKSRASSGKDVEAVSPDAMRVLAAYQWPGNVRELVHAIEYAVIQARTKTIQISDLPPEITSAAPPEVPRQPDAPPPLPVSTPDDGAIAPSPALVTASPAPTPPLQPPPIAGARAGLSPDEERERILEVLAANGGNRQRAARALGVGRATLYRRMEALGLPTQK